MAQQQMPSSFKPIDDSTPALPKSFKPITTDVTPSPIPLGSKVGSLDPASPEAQFTIPASARTSRTATQQAPIQPLSGVTQPTRPLRPQVISDMPSEPDWLTRLNQSLESVANPQTLGDFGNLLIPTGVGQAIQYGKKLLGRYKVDVVPEVKPPINVGAAESVIKPSLATDIELPAIKSKLPIEPSVSTSTELATVPKSQGPRLSAANDMGGSLKLKFHDPTSKADVEKMFSEMFPEHRISVDELKSDPLLGAMTGKKAVFSVNFWSGPNKNRLDYKASKQALEDIGGHFYEPIPSRVSKAAEDAALDRALAQSVPNPGGVPVKDINELPIMQGSIEDLKTRMPKSTAPVTAPKVGKGEIAPPKKPPIEPPVAAGDLPLQPEGFNQLSARDKLKLQFDEISKQRRQQESILTSERGRRMSQALGSEAEGEDWAKEFMSAFKGEYEKVPFTGAKLEQPDVNELFTAVKQSPKITNWERPRAITGLNKILSGSEVPQENELKVLRRVLGIDFQRNLTPVGLVHETVNFPKAIQAAYDLSAPFRQALPVIHKKEWWTSWDDMIRSAGSQKFFDNLQESLREAPHFGLGQEAGLHLSDIGGTIAGREEQFLSNFAEKIPGIKASNRAYTGFLNKLRSDLYNRLIDNAIKSGKDPYKDLRLAEDLAKFVNTATGRGSLGSAEKWADGLNSIFFSPRFIASRVQMVANPVVYMKMPWSVRKEYLKSLAAIAATGQMMGQVAKMAGGEVNNDPTSADYGKIKFGNTRIDPYGGFQQYLVLFNRMHTGETTPSSGSFADRPYKLGGGFGLSTRRDVAVDFFANKLAPVPRFVSEWMDQTKNRGFNIPEETVRMFTPMLIQDIYDVAQEDPELLPITIPASAVGLGVQSYK